MKKILISLLLSLGLLFITSPQPAFAGTPTCDVFEKEFEGSEEIWYCTGGFDSVAQGAAHRLVLDCVDNCSFWNFLPNTEQRFNFTRGGIGERDDGTFYTCAILRGVTGPIVDTTLSCMQDNNGTVESCVPRISGRIENAGLFSDVEWCTAVIPDEFFIPRVKAIIEDELGPTLIPAPTLNPTSAPLNVDSATLDSLNPLLIEGSDQAETLSTPGGIVSRILDFAFPLAGLLLFVMITFGGFTMIVGANDKKAIETGRQRITSALIGFILLFASFWIMRLIELVFGVAIL